MTLLFSSIFRGGRMTQLNIGLSLLTILAYLSVFISPAYFWPAGLLALAIPVFFLIHLFFILYWFFGNYYKTLLSITTLLFGYGFLGVNIALNFESKPQKESFSVLSYNVRTFNAYTQKKDKAESLEMIEWLIMEDSDIKCVQEFYHQEKSDVYNTVKKIAIEAGYNFYVNSIENIRKENGFFGVAIFTKYPIIRAGDIPLSNKPHQKGIYADIKINKDTLRIFNVHLRSMSIDEEKLFSQGKNENNSGQLWDVLWRLKEGSEARAEQVGILMNYISKSPYPVILCADLNDVPFSYTYTEIRKYLFNSFEKAGYGFGFTYNGRLFFLRIDHQFYSHGLKAYQFETLRDLKGSDHFPIRSVYTFE